MINIAMRVDHRLGMITPDPLDTTPAAACVETAFVNFSNLERTGAYPAFAFEKVAA